MYAKLKLYQHFLYHLRKRKLGSKWKIICSHKNQFAGCEIKKWCTVLLVTTRHLFLISEWVGVKLEWVEFTSIVAPLLARSVISWHINRVLLIVCFVRRKLAKSRFTITEKLIPVSDFDPLSFLRNSVILFRTLSSPIRFVGYFLKRFDDTLVFRPCENKKKGGKESGEEMRFRMSESRSFSLIFSANKSF